jgi:hypothetical protein
MQNILQSLLTDETLRTSGKAEKIAMQESLLKPWAD